MGIKLVTASNGSHMGEINIFKRYNIQTDLLPSKHRTDGPKPIEYRFLNVVTTYGSIQPEGNCCNHVLPDRRFLNMKFGWTKYNGNVMGHLHNKLNVPIRVII